MGIRVKYFSAVALFPAILTGAIGWLAGSSRSSSDGNSVSFDPRADIQLQEQSPPDEHGRGVTTTRVLRPTSVKVGGDTHTLARPDPAAPSFLIVLNGGRVEVGAEVIR